MKLNINKACDLSSISVLPPHSRRSNAISSGVDSSGLGKIQTSQLRSQSEQSFSQGMSLSQLSQSSLDERFGSQERDNSSKMSCLAPIISTRDESQMQLSRSSNNVLRRWASASTPDQRCHVTEELEHRIGSMESSLNRLGRILDSVQSDVMQVNKAVKEVSLEMEGIRQKMIIQDNSMQLMLKGQENTKAGLAGTLKSIPDQLRKESDRHTVHEIAAAISSLPVQIEACLLRLQHEICGAFTKEMETIMSTAKPPNSNRLHYGHEPAVQPKRSCISTRSQKNQPPTIGIAAVRPTGRIARTPVPKMEAEIPKILKPKPILLSRGKRSLQPKQEEIPLTGQEQDFRVIIESDEEIDGGFSCLFGKKETGGLASVVPYLSEESREETMRILRKARRKRKISNTIILD